MKKTLIITQSFPDPHIISVCDELKLLHNEPIILSRYAEENYISFSYLNFDGRLEFFVENNHHIISDQTIHSIFWRPKPTLLSEIPGELGTVEEKFRSQEWRYSLASLADFCPNAKWINSLEESRKISNKPSQLKLALECKLKIPKTIVTNRSDSVLKFFNINDKVIYKPLASFISSKNVIYTSQTDLDEINVNKTSIFLAPGIYQEEIIKKYELRVTIVGEEFFIVKIDSQSLPETQLDWRYNQTTSIMSVSDLTEKTKKKLLSFHKKSGLKYCAYDFIVDKQGTEIFLEANPSGQWLFLCAEVATKISRAIALILTR